MSGDTPLNPSSPLTNPLLKSPLQTQSLKHSPDRFQSPPPPANPKPKRLRLPSEARQKSPKWRSRNNIFQRRHIHTSTPNLWYKNECYLTYVNNLKSSTTMSSAPQTSTKRCTGAQGESGSLFLSTGWGIVYSSLFMSSFPPYSVSWGSDSHN